MHLKYFPDRGIGLTFWMIYLLYTREKVMIYNSETFHRKQNSCFIHEFFINNWQLTYFLEIPLILYEVCLANEFTDYVSIKGHRVKQRKGSKRDMEVVLLSLSVISSLVTQPQYPVTKFTHFLKSNVFQWDFSL